MRIDKSLHRRQPWRVHAICSDFELEDVWRFPIEASGEDSFEAFRATFQQAVAALAKSGAVGLLFRLRRLMGRWFRWDTARSAANVLARDSLLDRYLRDSDGEGAAERGEEVAAEFYPVYILASESLAEIANKTVHAALHLGWIVHDDGRISATLAVYVRTRGRFTRWYMTAINPFRHYLVYPAMMRRTARMWTKRALTRDRDHVQATNQTSPD